MTSTLSGIDEEIARRRALRDARVLRERQNRVGTNLKPHLKELVEQLAEENHVNNGTFIRMLVCEALEARGHNLNEVLKAWKERNPEEEE